MTAHQDSIELDGGRRQRQRERLCAATRTVRPVADLIRFVVGPHGEAVADVKLKLPGRGVWVTATRDALAGAIERNVFARSFKRPIRLPADLLAQTERSLEGAMVDALAMAGKSGLVAVGFAKTEAALARDDVIAILHAAEAAADGVRKLDAASRRRRSGVPPVVIGILNSAQLDLALGRPNVIHAALLDGPASHTFLTRFRRLERFRADSQERRTGRGRDRAESAN